MLGSYITIWCMHTTYGETEKSCKKMGRSKASVNGSQLCGLESWRQ